MQSITRKQCDLEREQAYLNPPMMTERARAKHEIFPGEYYEIEKVLREALEKVHPWPDHLDNDPVSIAYKIVQGAFWSRATGDSNYYAVVIARYGHLLPKGIIS